MQSGKRVSVDEESILYFFSKNLVCFDTIHCLILRFSDSIRSNLRFFNIFILFFCVYI